MRKRFLFILPAVLILLISCAAAENASEPESPAEEISKQCRFNKNSGESNYLTDGLYGTMWESVYRDGEESLVITAPEGKKIAAVYLQWRYPPVPIHVQGKSDSGAWQTLYSTNGDFYVELLEVPDLSEVKLIGRDRSNSHFALAEVRVFTPGALPDGLQRWELPGNKVDLMLIAGHPDDEVLWFGGLLPHYAAQGKNILVICAAMTVSYRKLELLDCLWACGVRTQPVFCLLYDSCPQNINKLWHWWGDKDMCLKRFTEYYRAYRPDVVMLHDVDGEYGHTVHKAVSILGRECAPLAADPKAYPDQVKRYGTWEIPKIYIHLYPKNQLKMDWWQPLDHFGGRTAQDVARDAFECHKSQQGRNWLVVDGGKYDNSLFGMYSSTVGEDTEKNDLFEHISR